MDLLYGHKSYDIDSIRLKDLIYTYLGSLGRKKKVLLIPPDITRIHSRAGEICQICYNYYGDALYRIIPALGTHEPMTEGELNLMFPHIPHHLFYNHSWQNDLETLGRISKDEVCELSEGALNFSWPIQINRDIVHGEYDLILSIGQVVPHEVVGMANYTKNLLVGVGGAEAIHKSHFLGAVYGMERIMGHENSPVRSLFDRGFNRYLKSLPIHFIQTVLSFNQEGSLSLRGVFASSDRICYEKACSLAANLGIKLFKEPLNHVLVYLDPKEYRSTWLGNKAIYRTRMALGAGARLVIVAPGLKQFGESQKADSLIRKYAYQGREALLALSEKEQDLKDNLSIAAHLIHGSSEGRFNISYATPFLSPQEIEGVGYSALDYNSCLNEYGKMDKSEGFYKTSSGEEFYFIPNPALGLWSRDSAFKTK